MSVILVVAGIFGIAAGVFGKNFYADGQPDQKLAPWFGRLVFILAGAGLLARGIVLLFWKD